MAEEQSNLVESQKEPEIRDHAVLSDQDIITAIEAQNLIFTEDGEDCSSSKGVRGDCYDLRVGYVLRKGKRPVQGHSVMLRPGEMATLLSYDWLNLPCDITGMVIPRNTQARRGILMLNAGHIDPMWTGQIMAQVINLSDQDRSIRLKSFDDSVFSVVFSYLTTPAKKKPNNPQDSANMEKSERDRLAELQRDIDEQSDTLILAERVMQERFVPRSHFASLLLSNVIGFLIIVGVIITILAQTDIVDLKELSKKVKLNLDLWVASLIVIGAVAIGQAIVAPFLSWIIRRLLAWWRYRILS